MSSRTSLTSTQHVEVRQAPRSRLGGGRSSGSTTIDCSSPWATSHRPKPRQTTGGSKERRPPMLPAYAGLRLKGLNHEYMAQPGGASGGPCGGLEERESQNPSTNLTVRPTGSDSSQQASSKPGAVQTDCSLYKTAKGATAPALSNLLLECTVSILFRGASVRGLPGRRPRHAQ